MNKLKYLAAICKFFTLYVPLQSKIMKFYRKATALQVCGGMSIVTSTCTYLLQLLCDGEELRTDSLNVPKVKALSTVLCSYILLSDSL